MMSLLSPWGLLDSTVQDEKKVETICNLSKVELNPRVLRTEPCSACAAASSRLSAAQDDNIFVLQNILVP